MTDYHKILGLKRNATKAQIKRAYRRLALKWHPDKNKSPDAEAMFIKITEAYKVLSNPDTNRKSRSRKTRSSSTRKQHKKTQDKSAYKKWSDFMAECAQKEAKREAQMKYKDFKRAKFKYEKDSRTLFFFIITLTFLTIFYAAEVGNLRLAMHKEVTSEKIKEAREALNKAIRTRNILFITLTVLVSYFVYRYQKNKKHFTG